MARLKADVHAHTSDDPRDEIAYSAESLIDAAAAKGVEVLAITCHGLNAYNEYLAEFARRRGVLLVPGIESNVDGRHVIILNPDLEQSAAKTFAELRALGTRNAALIAAHPYFPAGSSLMDALLPNIDLFHAIELCGFYFLGIDFNRKAIRVAREHNLPMVGTSDTHVLPYDDTTFTWIEAEKTVESVIDGIRAGRVEVSTRPKPLPDVANMLKFAVEQTLRDWRKARMREARVR